MKAEFSSKTTDRIRRNVECLRGVIFIVICVPSDRARCDIGISLHHRRRRRDVEADKSIRYAAGGVAD